MVGEHGQGAIRLLVGMVHMLDEVTSEIPVLEPDGVTSLLQHPSNPSRPGAISFVKADKEVTLDSQIIGESCGLSVSATQHCKQSINPAQVAIFFCERTGLLWGRCRPTSELRCTAYTWSRTSTKRSRTQVCSSFSSPSAVTERLLLRVQGRVDARMPGRMAVLRGGNLNGPATYASGGADPGTTPSQVSQGSSGAPDPGGPQSLAGPTALFGQRGPLGPAPLRFGPPAAHGEQAGLRGRPLIGASCKQGS